MANRKFIFVNTDNEYEEEVESVNTSAGAGDAGKLVTLDSSGKFDPSLLPDSLINGYDWKESVRVASSTNVTISAPGATIDGVTMANGDRVLLSGQTVPAENGIYIFNGAASAMTRAPDSDEDVEVTSGNRTFVEEGTCAEKIGTLITNDPIVVGTTAQTWKFQGVESLTGGDGITIAGGVVSVDLVADGGLEFATGELQVKFADTSVAADLDGTNGLHAISAVDLTSNGANQGANILGFDPANCASITATTIQGAVDEVCALAEAGASVSYTVGTGGVTLGDLLYIDSNDTVLPLPITGANSNNWGIGLAFTTEAAAGSVQITPNDVILAGALTGATAGDTYYWDGSALTTTQPAGGGSMVWIVGYAKNATDLHVDIRHVKRNAA